MKQTEKHSAIKTFTIHLSLFILFPLSSTTIHLYCTMVVKVKHFYKLKSSYKLKTTKPYTSIFICNKMLWTSILGEQVSWQYISMSTNPFTFNPILIISQLISQYMSLFNTIIDIIIMEAFHHTAQHKNEIHREACIHSSKDQVFVLHENQII